MLNIIVCFAFSCFYGEMTSYIFVPSSLKTTVWMRHKKKKSNGSILFNKGMVNGECYQSDHQSIKFYMLESMISTEDAKLCLPSGDIRILPGEDRATV